MSEKLGFLGKKSFGSFVDYGCDRKLYLDLGNHDSRWVQRDIKIRSGKSDITKETLKLGKEYEQNVYQKLFEQFPEHIYAKRIHSSVVNTTYELFFDYHSSEKVSYSFPIVHFISSMWLHHTFFKKCSIRNKSKTSSFEAISKTKFVSRM